jgi:hypothetical protein
MLKAKTVMTANPKQYFRRQKAGISYTSIPFGIFWPYGEPGMEQIDESICTCRADSRAERAAGTLGKRVLTLSRDMAFLSMNP